jgi:hypothetical protein
MVDVGDRIEVESERVGGEPRAGTVTRVNGDQLQVRWDDGHETSIVPGPGLRVPPELEDVSVSDDPRRLVG